MVIENKNDKSWWRPGLVLFFKLSGWIGFPVIIALFIGKWLDKKYHTEPWLFLFSVAFAFLISMFGIIKESFKEMKKIEEDAKRQKKIHEIKMINNIQKDNLKQ